MQQFKYSEQQRYRFQNGHWKVITNNKSSSLDFDVFQAEISVRFLHKRFYELGIDFCISVQVYEFYFM